MPTCNDDSAIGQDVTTSGAALNCSTIEATCYIIISKMKSKIQKLYDDVNEVIYGGVHRN